MGNVFDDQKELDACTEEFMKLAKDSNLLTPIVQGDTIYYDPREIDRFFNCFRMGWYKAGNHEAR